MFCPIVAYVECHIQAHHADVIVLNVILLNVVMLSVTSLDLKVQYQMLKCCSPVCPQLLRVRYHLMDTATHKQRQFILFSWKTQK
jgi:hypothetical protein